VGVIISQANPQLHRALLGVSLYSFVSGLSDHITANILEDDTFTDNYIRQNREKLSRSYRFITDYAKDHNITYAPGCNAAFFLWVDLGKRYLDTHPESTLEGNDLSDEVMRRLLGKRVFLASGVLFGSEKPGWFRIVFALPREYLEEALKRMVSAIDE
jgi:aspartate/methionine/tyrosine aminotransferase